MFAAETGEDDELIVVTHSHGFNAVLGANVTVLNRIKLVVALSAPILSVQKLPLGWFMWGTLAFLEAMLAAGAFGIMQGMRASLAAPSTLRAIGMLFVGVALAVGTYRVAQSKYAFLWLPVAFSLLILQAYHTLVADLPHGVLDASGSQPSSVAHPIILPAMPGGWIADVLVVGSFYVLATLPLFLLAAYTSSRALRAPSSSLLQAGRVATPRVIHFLKANDEVFALLGLTMALQRVIELPLALLLDVWDRRIRRRWWIVAGILFAVPRFPTFFHLNPTLLIGGVFALTVAPLAVLTVVKVFLFGSAFGWDVAGLSIDHSIYVTAGSPGKQTDLRVLPRSGAGVEVAHSIWSDGRVVAALIQEVKRELLPADA